MRVICDFSLMHAKSRPAAVADRLVVKDFGRGTLGFADASEVDTPFNEATAVCVMPGTEIVFDADVSLRCGGWLSKSKIECLTARFRQVDKDCSSTHHDALEFATGDIVKLTMLAAGQTATVLQLPAAPKTKDEADAQERLAVVA